MLMGGSITLFVQGIVKAVLVLKCKYLFRLAIGGLLSSISVAMMAYFRLYSSHKEIIGIVLGIMWFIMIQCTTWLFTLRITSLNPKSNADRYIYWIPYIFIAIEIPSSVSIVLDAIDSKYHQLYLDCSLAFTICAIVLEAFIYIVLVKKLRKILNNAEDLGRTTLQTAKIALTVLLLTKIVIIIAKSINSIVDLSIRPFATLLRLYIVLQFYGVYFEKASQHILPRSRQDSLYENVK